MSAPDAFTYERWRHGGWYVAEVRYPSGACGCVSRNYADRKWRIACDDRPGDHTYPNRDAAARAEWELVEAMKADPVDVCAACGQSVLTTPDDPPATLLCDVCLASLERRREVRRANAALNQGGLC